MIRVRRYRVFLAVVVFFFTTIYFFHRSPSWESGTTDFSGSFKVPQTHSASTEGKAGKTLHQDARPPSNMNPAQHRSSSSTTSTTSTSTLISIESNSIPRPSKQGDKGGMDDLKEASTGLGADRLDPEPQEALPPVIHWSSQKEHFPITSTIQLPTGTPVSIPKIQFDFDRESVTDKAKREEKLNAIRTSFKRSWTGYRKYAWMHDELRPVSGGHKDPFCGWAATLVDSLDTLWIMGLEEEFNEAVKAVEDIDFTTSKYRNEIPVFETTIRYLGGLIGAYDISGRKGQYRVLLDKAVQLAEVIMGAFDTPNRMPLLYYGWKPAFASQAHRSGSNIVLAELGSLSLEFTHLAQLTGEPKYYDAVARITERFEEFQNRTKLPGMWPLFIDATGCSGKAPAKLDDKFEQVAKEPPTHHTISAYSEDDDDEGPPDSWKDLKDSSSFGTDGTKQPVVSEETAKAPYKDKDVSSFGEEEDLLTRSRNARRTVGPLRNFHTYGGSNCIDEGFMSPMGGASAEVFTLGGMADSTYEYLPKQYLMLGGLSEQYKTMYLGVIDTVKEYLLYRPMIKENRKVLFTGGLDTDGSKDKSGRVTGTLKTEVGHLNCFVGGMVALGSKIFNRPDELKIAHQLTDGCVWLYDITATGIMPESSDLIACDSIEDCPWNQTTYYAHLDPFFKSRLAPVETTDISGLSAPKYNDKPAPISSIPEMEVAKPPEVVPRQLGSLSSAPSRKSSKGSSSSDLDDPWDESSSGSSSNSDSSKSSSSSSSVSSTSTSSKSSTSTSSASSTSTSSRSSTSTSSQSSEPTSKEDAKAPGHSKVGTSKEPIDPNGVLKKPLHTADKPASHVDSASMIHSTYHDGDEGEEDDDATGTESVQTHQQYVLNRIKDERLPPGITRLGARHYILRPEAIESVFYMYRITGHSYWREKGWKMFQSIEKATKTEYGSSGIQDVTVNSPNPDDKMESFWLAETLKYFYLLFSHESVGSLDDYVLNTEAHFFLRPDVATRSTESSLGYPG